MKRLILASMVILAAGPAFAAGEEAQFVTLNNGLRYSDTKPGHGETAEIGKVVVVHMTGWIDDDGHPGKQVLDTLNRGQPVTYKLGANNVMPAWNDGVAGMKAGGSRMIMVPAELGFGAKGSGNLVGPGDDLILQVELLEVREPG